MIRLTLTEEQVIDLQNFLALGRLKLADYLYGEMEVTLNRPDKKVEQDRLARSQDLNVILKNALEKQR